MLAHTCESRHALQAKELGLTLSQRTTANRRIENAIKQIRARRVYLRTGARTAPLAASCCFGAMLLQLARASQPTQQRTFATCLKVRVCILLVQSSVVLGGIKAVVGAC